MPQDYNSLLVHLEKYDIEPQDLYREVLLRGVDLDEVNLNDPQQYQEFLPLLEESLGELNIDFDRSGSLESMRDTLTGKPSDLGMEEDLPVTDSVPVAKQSVTRPRDPLDSTQIYLHNLLGGGNIGYFEQSTGIQAPQDYILGAGDRVAVTIWGRSVYQSRLTVNQYGELEFESPPLRIAVGGLSVARASQLVKNYLKRYYQFDDSDFAFVVQSSRSLRVSVYGEVRAPGTYTMPATNSLINVISLAEGPTPLGTVRQIFIRSGTMQDTIDLYRYFEDPNAYKSLTLADHTIVTVPTSSKRLQVSGAILRPGYYDLLPDEGLQSLLKYAGGLTPDAYLSKVQIRRTEEGISKIVDIDLQEVKIGVDEVALQNGDHIRILRIDPELDNVITVQGAVYQPGEFAWTTGVTLADILRKAGLTASSRRDLAYIARKTVGDNVFYERVNLVEWKSSASGQTLLRPGDKVIVLNMEKYVSNSFISVTGAIRDTGYLEYDQESSLRVTDALELAGGTLPIASGLVFVMREREIPSLGLEYLRVDLRDIAAGDSSQNIYLQAGDSLYVEDASEFYSDAFVEISGEVNRPGKFSFDGNLTLKDLLFLASGYKVNAARNRIDVYRLSHDPHEGNETFLERVDYDPLVTDEDSFVLRPYDRVIVRNIKNYRLQRMVTISGEVNFPGPYALIGDNQRLTDLLAQAGGMTEEAFPQGATLYRIQDSTGYVVMKLDQALRSPQSPYNYVLHEGDVLSIPKSREFVSISGAVNAQDVYPDKFINQANTIKVPFEGENSAKYYIDNYAAGISGVGDKNQVSVEYANGQVRSTRKFLFFKAYPKVKPGCQIHVGYKVPKPIGKKEKTTLDWTKLIGQTLAQATAVLSLILLVRELN